MKRLLSVTLVGVLLFAGDVAFQRLPWPVAHLRASLPASDNFNRADGGLGGNWALQQNSGCTLQVASNVVVTNLTSTSCSSLWTADTPGNDQICTITIKLPVNTDHYWNCELRGSGTTTATANGYYCGGNSSTYFITKMTGGGTSALATNSWSPANGDIFTCSAVGTLLTLKKNGTTVNTATDSTYTSGSGGVLLYDSGGTGGVTSADDFTIDTVASTSAPRRGLLLGVGN